MTVRILTFFLALVSFLPELLFAQSPAATPTESAASLSTPSIAAKSPPAPTTATYTLTAEQREKAIAYARARYRLHFFAFFWSVFVLILIIRARLGPRFRDRAESMAKRRFWQAAIFVPLLVVTESLLELPTSAYGHHLSRLYGQSVQGWGSWIWDEAKGLIVGIIVAIPLVWLLYAFLRRSPRRWWLWFWLALLPILVFLIFLTPIFVEPLFFEFEPLAPKHPELAQAIERVTVRAGEPIPQSKMFAMNASSKYNSVNAYVSGLGASKRVVVWDTTMAKATIPQTLFVFGHEMGHYVLGHIPRTIAFLWAMFFVWLAAGAWILRRLFPDADGAGGPATSRWGVRGLTDWASLPVLFLLVTIGSELCTPLISGFVRSQEHEADRFGLEAIHGLVPDSAGAAAGAFQILGEVNLADPDPSPFIRFWLYDHPPLAERLRFAATYDPWGKGEPPRYVK
jgi:STE24 endopeptidase